ncbi:sensor histidine kinase [Chitinophaga nivalis]|uniref:Histidine kinase n=1 Tax=Chitinophaga nivalis TaxID=2991709 RepID=A0ABT3IPY2_9BACT|nr:histidine kinase [Chitinophaga nivalis]MCW3464282.1 histidine kinase [Chitinophaga nivalis]MCW3486027.1 histidine kinase [Chitinophaga nivalis]
MFRLKYSVLITHITGWLLCLSLPLFFISGQTSKQDAITLLSSADYYIFLLIYISFFYFHGDFLLPRIYFRKQYLLYTLVVLFLLLIINFMQPFTHLFPSSPAQNNTSDNKVSLLSDISLLKTIPVDIAGLLLLLLLLALSTAIGITRRWQQQEKQALYAINWKVQAELTVLKAQIQPHFLFNTLNNIYSLAITRHEHTATAILKLSNILRYITAGNRDDYVLLQHEIDCLNDYIDLQKLRLTSHTKVNLTITGSPDIKCIAPLLLLPFLENAFKHGVSNQENSVIDIRLDISAAHILFCCRNRLFSLAPDIRQTGNGIITTRQRLEHLYPDKYELSICTNDGDYTITLQLRA